MFRVENTLCVHIPVSRRHDYIDNVANADLRMNRDDHVPKRIGQRRDARLQVPDVEAGNLPLHPLLVTYDALTSFGWPSSSKRLLSLL